MRLNLSFHDVRNCKETITFVKECQNIIECKKKGILNLANKQGLLFNRSKEPEKFKEMYKKIEQVEIVKVSEKYPKLKVVINFK